MKKLYLIILILIFSLSYKSAYGYPYTNPLGGDWITLDSSLDYKHWDGDSSTAIYMQIACYDSLNCVALVDDGMHGFDWSATKKTTDGGATWSVILLDSTWMQFPQRVKIFYPAKDIIVIGCDSGYVVRSTDGAATWESKKRVEIPAKNGRLWQMFMKGNIAIMQFEGCHDDYISLDWGETWKKIENFGVQFIYGFASYYSIIDSATIFASGYVQEKTSPTETKEWTYYLLTTDQGKTWSEVNKIPSEETYYLQHVFVNKDIGYSRSFIRHDKKGNDIWDTTTTKIYKTYNGGKTWNKTYEITDLGKGYGYFYYYDDNNIMAASFDNFIYSSDGGYNWEKIKGPVFEDVKESGISFTSAMLTPRSWITGCGPKLLKYVGKDKSISEARLEGEAITVSPNPAHDFISLSGFESTPGGSIEIYSQLGIKALEAAPAAERIDVSALPAGVYFIRSGGSAGKFVKL